MALISQRLLGAPFDGDPDVIGKTISLERRPALVIGIVGTAFDFEEFGPNPEVWVPFQLDPNTTDQGHYFIAAGG